MQRRDNPLLKLCSLVYGAGVSLRNYLFNSGLLREHHYDIPLICVGNITVGGTGKTPHIELIIELLRPSYRLAVISRGYKRSSRGLQDVTPGASVQQIGDEPKQLSLKYPEVRLIVDGDRRRAMRYLMALPEAERPEVVLLDDGFQHRYVHPSFSILLVDASRELHEDALLPAGNLREPASARYRADCIIMTKCPEDMSPIQMRIMQRNLALYPHQQIFFSHICYHRPRRLRSLAGLASSHRGGELPDGVCLVALSGIAAPQSFHSYLESKYRLVERLVYPDHHSYRSRDLAAIAQRYEALRAQSPDPLYLMTTEKDAVRLVELQDELPAELVDHLYYLPIRTEILYQREAFEQMLQRAASALPPALRR